MTFFSSGFSSKVVIIYQATYQSLSAIASSWRIVSFSFNQELDTGTMQFLSATHSTNYLMTDYDLGVTSRYVPFQTDTRSEILFDTESHGSGVYFAYLDDPEHANASNTALYELHCFRVSFVIVSKPWCLIESILQGKWTDHLQNHTKQP